MTSKFLDLVLPTYKKIITKDIKRIEDALKNVK
jgi:hypothetical protein